MPFIVGIRDDLWQIRDLTHILGEHVQLKEDRERGRGTAEDDFHATMEQYEMEMWTEWDEDWYCAREYASSYVLVRKLSAFYRCLGRQWST